MRVLVGGNPPIGDIDEVPISEIMDGGDLLWCTCDFWETRWRPMRMHEHEEFCLWNRANYRTHMQAEEFVRMGGQ